MTPFPDSSLLFQPKSISELCSIAYHASYLEITSEPKPGNVSPHQSVGKAQYHDFLQSIDAIYKFNLNFFSPQQIIQPIGDYFLGAVETMMSVQSAGNVLLGHILLFAPLLFAGHTSLMKLHQDSWDMFWERVNQIIGESTPEDSVHLYRAIQLANPGGLKNPGGIIFHPTYDFTAKDTEIKIRNDQQKLRELFRESAKFDLISREYLENYNFCRKILLDWAIPHFSSYDKCNDFVVDLFLQILASHFDSLIYRKNTLDIANQITKEAEKIVNSGGILTSTGMRLIHQLNNRLLEGKGKLNPGTSADLTACVLFIGNLFGLFQFKC